ncbi:hypothetical protein ISP17_11250 [Dyella ginsengisoli]|uniref:Uncharacterized protein n=1 Tax=Dyella ginsengisoli TaxID=363848 RepID=A0ABW8JTV9_9GAMM
MITALLAKLTERTMRREPDFIVGDSAHPYLRRWYLLGSTTNAEGRRVSRSLLGICRIYVHEFLRSDDDRAHHDHPAASLSVATNGEGIEHTIAAGGTHHRRTIQVGTVRWRRATFAHRIEIPADGRLVTVFVFFRNVREWGFHCPRGWVPWQQFVASDNPGAIGAGCGED